MINIDRIVQKMQMGVKDEVFPGAVYAIVHNNEVFSAAVGNKSLYPTIEPNSLDTIYDLASLTKVVATNTIIAKLLEDKKIFLNDCVTQYLPQFKYSDVTIYHLLTHSSGLPADLDWEKMTTRDELINRVFAIDKTYETGSLALYSDVSFILLGFIIEKITNQNLVGVAKEMVFIPLAMNDTSYLPTEIARCAPTEWQNNAYTKGIVHDEKTKLLDGVAGSAGVFGTISDLTKFIKMILNDGMVNGQRYLAKRTIDLWFKKEKVTNVDSWRSIGWICGPHNAFSEQTSSETIFHGGYTGGRLLIDRQNKFAMAFLSNRVHPTRENTKIVSFSKEVFSLAYEVFNPVFIEASKVKENL